MLANALKKIGFTQQEATLYIILCKNGALTGYEAAKLSGISRSNAYAALSSLVDKGYAYVIEGASVKYMPVTKEDLIANARRDFDEQINIIQSQLEFTKTAQEPYITITGEHQIIHKLKNIIDASEKRIYISGDYELLESLSPELQKAIDRDLKVVVLSSKPLSISPCIFYLIEPKDSFKMIADTSEVIAGTLVQALYSKNSTLLALMRESFINEIAVIEAKFDKKD